MNSPLLQLTVVTIRLGGLTTSSGMSATVSDRELVGQIVLMITRPQGLFTWPLWKRKAA